eukprot:scpid88731/ scgid12469/ 
MRLRRSVTRRDRRRCTTSQEQRTGAAQPVDSQHLIAANPARTHGHPARTPSKDTQQGHPARTPSKDTQQGHPARFFEDFGNPSDRVSIITGGCNTDLRDKRERERVVVVGSSSYAGFFLISPASWVV